MRAWERGKTLTVPVLRWTIKRKLLVLGIATVLPLLCLVVFWAYWEGSRTREEQAEHLGLASLQAARLVEHDLGHVRDLLGSLAAKLGPALDGGLEPLLRDALAALPVADNLLALGPDGRVLAAAVTQGEAERFTPGGRPWLDGRIAVARLDVGDLETARSGGESVVAVTVAVEATRRGAAAALVAVLSPGRLGRPLQSLVLPAAMTITMVDGEGTILLHLSRVPGTSTGQPFPAASALPAGPAVVAAAGVSDGPQLAGVAPIAGTRWRVLVGVSQASLQARVWQEMRTIAFPLLALLAASAVAGLLVARRVWQPLAALTGAVRRLAPGEFTPVPVSSSDEVGALSRAFNEMAAQIRDSKAMVERQLSELNGLSEAGRLLTSTLEISQVLSRFADLVSGRLGVDVVRIWLLDQASGEVHLHAQSGATRGREYSLRIPRGQGLVGWIIERREPVVLSDLRTDPRLIDQPWLKEEGFVSYLGVPIVLEELTVGVLVCLDRQARDFSAEDVALAQIFAVPAAVAIRNARLYGDAQASALELAARNHRLELLYETARVMTAELDIERLLERIVEHTRQMLGARYGALLVSSDDRRVSRLFTAGLSREERDQMGSLPEGRGLLGHVIEHGALRLDDLSAHPAAAGFPPGHPPMRSLLAVPIRHRERVLGALYLTEKPGGFAAEDAALLTTMAADAAVAIENASLVKRLRDALDDLKAAQGRLVETEAMRAVGEVAGGVAHHLNNALTVIRGRAELALQTVEDPRLRSTLAVVERTAVNGAGILRRLQEMTTAPPARPGARVDLAGVTRAALERSEPRWRDGLGARDISIEVSAEAGSLPPVAGDRAALEEVMASLLLNAVEATPEGGRITVRLWAKRGSVHCAVGDSGAGMSEEERKRAVEPFFTTKGSRRAGLGLSVSHGIVQRHGGSLNIESTPGRGTTVTISLPAASAQAGPEEHPGEGAG